MLEILSKIGINKTATDLLSKNVVLLNKDELRILNDKAPFLVYA